jgi:hypothetical protein
MQLLVESIRDGSSVFRTERRTEIIGCREEKWRNKVNAQQSNLHRGTSISVEKVNIVNVERIFACYRKLEETDCRLPEKPSFAAYFLLLRKVNLIIVSPLYLYVWIPMSLCPPFQISSQMRTALFRVITQQVVVISYRRFGKTYRSHPRDSRVFNPENGNERLSRNVGKKLPLLSA